MGLLQTPELLSDYLTFLFNDVPGQDVYTGALALASNSEMRDGFWKYIQGNFGLIKERIGGNPTVMEGFLRFGLRKFADRDTESEIRKFFEGKDNKGYDRTLLNISETILGRAGYKQRDEKVILEWLKTNGYA